MACISHPVDIPVPTFDEEERETEHNPPADNVYQYLQGTTCGCKGLFHKDKDNSFIGNYPFYSYLMASIGSKSAAFLAGYHPKKTPVTVHTAKERNTLHGWI